MSGKKRQLLYKNYQKEWCFVESYCDLAKEKEKAF